MNGLFDAGRWPVVFGLACMLQVAILGQVIRLPGGITIGEPQQGNRPVKRPERPERPDPERVCPKTVEWVETLQREYPGVDLAHTVSNRVQQMAVPLFADAVFQKEFGVSYAKLSDVERRDFFRMHLIPCTNQRLYGPQMVVLQVFNPPFLPGTAGSGPLSPGQLIPALSRLDAARATLQADTQLLAGTVPSVEAYDRAAKLSEQRKDELVRVWPSEKAQFEGVVKAAVARSANAAVQFKIQPLLDAPPSPQAVKQLRDAPRTYSTLFQAMPADQRTVVANKLEERRNAVLHELIPRQVARADSFPPTRQGLDDGAEWFASYQAVFLEPPVLPEAAALAKIYLSNRETALAKLAPQFRQKIETSQDADAVALMYDEVFRLPDDRQTAVYKDISAARVARADLLNKRAEQARQAAEEKLEKAALLRGDIVPSSLKVTSLTNAKIFRAIYVGDFAHAGIQRANVFFEDMFDSYLQQFGQACRTSLPSDQVEMSEPECKEWIVTTNPFGMKTAPDRCIVWGRRPLGIYADPRAFAAKEALEDVAQRNAMRGFLQVLATPDPLGNMMSQTGGIIQDAQSLKHDTPQLITENGCGSKALARLQENMTRFANGDDPLHVAGFSPETTKATRAQDLDVRGLADDLIRANAAGWILNRYTGLDGAEVNGGLDAQARPRHIQATYDQKGMTGRGSVDIAFVDGVPSCLYFADDPGNCKAPSPSVVKRYENGEYRRKTGR